MQSNIAVETGRMELDDGLARVNVYHPTWHKHVILEMLFQYNLLASSEEIKIIGWLVGWGLTAILTHITPLR